jgi:hypothetical protein
MVLLGFPASLGTEEHRLTLTDLQVFSATTTQAFLLEVDHLEQRHSVEHRRTAARIVNHDRLVAGIDGHIVELDQMVLDFLHTLSQQMTLGLTVQKSCKLVEVEVFNLEDSGLPGQVAIRSHLISLKGESQSSEDALHCGELGDQQLALGQDTPILDHPDGSPYIPDFHCWFLLLCGEPLDLQASIVLPQQLPGLIWHHLEVFLLADIFPHSVVIVRVVELCQGEVSHFEEDLVTDGSRVSQIGTVELLEPMSAD